MNVVITLAEALCAAVVVMAAVLASAAAVAVYRIKKKPLEDKRYRY